MPDINNETKEQMMQEIDRLKLEADRLKKEHQFLSTLLGKLPMEKEQMMQQWSEMVALVLRTDPVVQVARQESVDNPMPENQKIAVLLVARKAASLLGEQYGLSPEEIPWFRTSLETTINEDWETIFLPMFKK